MDNHLCKNALAVILINNIVFHDGRYILVFSYL